MPSAFFLKAQEGVLIPLLLYRGVGGRAVIVSRPDDGVVGEREDVLLDCIHEGFHRAAGEVGPPDPCHEEGITGKEVFSPVIQADASGGMSRLHYCVRVRPVRWRSTVGG